MLFNEDDFLREYARPEDNHVYTTLTICVGVGISFFCLFISCLLSTGWESKREFAMWCIVLFLGTIISFGYAYIYARINKNKKS